MFYKLTSKLLDYPNEELLAALPELASEIKHGIDSKQQAAEWVVLDDFITYLSSLDPTDAQAAYVQTFDLTPEHALQLTHHLFGDDKNRGPALIDLSEFYKEYGLEMRASAAAANDGTNNELPDYLPLVLEFAAMLETEEAHMFLSQWTKVLNVLAANLEEAGSPYAPLIRLVEQRSLLVKEAA